MNTELKTINIIKQTIKENIIKIMNDNIEDYNFKEDIMDEITTSSDHIFKNMNIQQLESDYKDLFIEDTTTYYYEKCIENIVLHNKNLITNLNEPENLYIIINNNVFNNNVQYGILGEYENSTINYHTFSESELKTFQKTFNQNNFIILTDQMFIFVIKLDFIQEELLNSSNVYLK